MIRLDREPKKILVIRLSSIGDVLLSTPLLRLLRKRFPDSEISYAIKKQYVDLIRTNPDVDRIFLFDEQGGWQSLREMKLEIMDAGFELVLDIHKNFRSCYLSRGLRGAVVVRFPKYYVKRWLLVKFGWNFYKEIVPVYKRYFKNLSPIGIVDDGQGLTFYPENAVREKIKKDLQSHGIDFNKLLVGLAPGAGFATKRWPVEYFIWVGQRLVREKNAQVVLFGDEKDRGLTGQIVDAIGPLVIDCAGRFSLMETGCAMSFMNIMISNDTGLMHMATALKIKTLAIFGPTTRELGFFPVGEQTRYIENTSLSCRPCSHVGSKKCPKKHFKCMWDVKPDQVYKIIIQRL